MYIYLFQQNYNVFMLTDEYLSKATKDLWNGALGQKLETELLENVSTLLDIDD